MRCRLVDTTTPETQVNEAAGDLTLAYENVGRFNLAAVNATEFPWAMAGVAALGLLIWQRMQKKGEVMPSESEWRRIIETKSPRS